MKLYSFDLSPYAARVRMAIYAKALPIEILPPPGGATRSPEYLAINPIGKVPALVLDDGTVLPESEIIVEYLADAFPDSGLRPAKPLDAARSRLIARIVDVYVLPAGQPLMGQMNPQTRDAAIVETAFAKMQEAFTYLERFMTDDRYAVGDTVTIADCALVPLLFFMGPFRHLLGTGDLLAPHPKLAAYWSRMLHDPAAKKLIGELHAGLRQVAHG
jgi:glutathione S-transferase